MAESIKLPKPKYGQIVVLQKNGDEPRGHGFPLIGVACTIGRCETCDIRVSSADVSLMHCRVVIEETSGEASLEILGQNTEVNGSIVEPQSTIKLKHKDVILVGSRRLRFEYLPPDYKPKPGKVQNGNSDNLRAEVVDTEVEVAEPVEPEKETKEPTQVQATPNASRKAVSFGPYLSPEQFDNNLPPATPLKRGATPRRSIRYSGLKFSQSPIKSVIEEEPSKDEEVSKLVVEETVLDSTTEATYAEKFDEEVPVSDAISTVSNDAASEVSNVSVLPSECCSYLDDSISVDNSSVVQAEENIMSTDIIEPPSVQDTPIASPMPDQESEEAKAAEQVTDENTTSSEPNGDAAEAESSPKKPASPSTKVETEVQGKQLRRESRAAPSTPKADYTDVRGVKKLLQTPKPQPESPKADYTDVSGVKKLLETPKQAAVSPKADYSNVEGVKKLLETPKPAPQSPKADYSNVAGIKKMMQTPKPAPESPKADYSNVTGVKELMQTPKPTPESPKADYSDVDGVKKLMQSAESTPKADYSNVEGVERLMKTPAVVTVATALTSSDRNANDSSTPKRGARRQSSRVSKAPTTSPKAEFAESQAPPAALMAGDEDEEEIPQQQTQSGNFKESAEGFETLAVNEKETTVIDQETGPQTLEEPIVEATPKRGGRKPPVASATKSSSRSRRSKVVEQAEEAEKPQQSGEEVKESSEKSPEQENIDEQDSLKIPEEQETTKESTEKVEGEEIQEIEEPVLEITPKRGGRKTTASSANKSAIRSRRSKDVEPAIELDLQHTVEGATEAVEEPYAEQDMSEIQEGNVEEPETQSPENHVEEGPEQHGATCEHQDQNDGPSIDIKEDAKEIERADGDSDQPTPRRGGRRAAATPKIESKIETPKSTRVKRGKKAEPAAAAAEEDPQQTTLTKSEISIQKQAVNLDSNIVESIAEEKAVIEKDAETEEAQVPIVAATPRRGGRKAPVTSATKSTTRSRNSPKAEPEPTVPEDFQETPSTISESNEESTTTDGVSVSEGQLSENKNEQEDTEKTEVPAVTPKRGGRKVPATSATKSTSRSRSQQKAETEQESSHEVPPVGSSSSSTEKLGEIEDSSADGIAEAEEKSADEKEQGPTDVQQADTEAPAVAATPRRAGRKAPAASATKASAAKSATRSRRVKAEEHAEKPQESSEQATGVIKESEEKNKSSVRPRRGKTTPEESPRTVEEQAPAKTTGRAKRGKATQEEEPEPEEFKPEESAELEGAQEGEVPEDVEPATPVTPKRGGRKTPAAKESASKNSRTKSADGDQPENAQDNQLESAASVSSEATEEDKPPVTPRRGSRKAAVAVALSVESPKPTRSKRAKRGSESDTTEIVEETSKEAPGKGARTKRGSKYPDSDDLVAEKNPVVRLTRMKVLTPVGEAPSARRGRGAQPKADPLENIESLEEDEKKPVARKARRGAKAVEEEKAVAVDSESEPEEEKKPVARRGRRGAKAAAEEAEQPEEPEVEEKTETKPARRGRVGSTDSDAQETKKPAGRRGAATKRPAAQEAVESTPPVAEKKRRGAKKPLDDVELKHEGKGHAADIHANHVPDDGPTEEEPAPPTRATRGKKVVHFDVASPDKPVRGTRGKAAGPAVVLERDPEIDSLAAAAKEEEPPKTTAKRGRAKAEPVPEEVAASPAKKRAARAKKVEPEQNEQAAPSPRRTRRARN